MEEGRRAGRMGAVAEPGSAGSVHQAPVVRLGTGLVDGLWMALPHATGILESRG
jgi:hypothetical protein